MKMKTAIFSLLALPLLATVANGQNLFRTGRPDYTRGYAATYHDRYTNQATQANQLGQRYPSNFNSTRQDSLERERLQAAWENYRREANRYQARYGSSTYANSDFNNSSYSASTVAPVGYESDVAPRCRRDSIPANGYDSNLTRPSLRPSNQYRNPDYYGDRSGYEYRSGSGNREFTSVNGNRTATRPFTSLLDTLFGINR